MTTKGFSGMSHFEAFSSSNVLSVVPDSLVGLKGNKDLVLPIMAWASASASTGLASWSYEIQKKII